PPRPDFTEPDLTAERAEAYTDTLAPLPAVAAAWRVPDPVADLAGYLPFVVLTEVLTDGDASRLVERMVLKDRSVTSVGGYIGFLGGPFAAPGPTRALFEAALPPGGDAPKVLAAMDEDCRRIA